MREVAVLVACHNYGRYLDECLRSVLNQTLLPAETVVVTDACSDESAEIARALIPAFALARVRYTVADSGNAKPGQSRAKTQRWLSAQPRWSSFSTRTMS